MYVKISNYVKYKMHENIKMAKSRKFQNAV